MTSFLAHPLQTISSWVQPEHKKKMIYNLSEGSMNDEQFLSRKAANLCELHRRGFSVPPAFILSSEASTEFNAAPDQKLSDAIKDEIKHAMTDLEKATDRGFGAATGPQPLLLSIRGGPLVNPISLISTEDRPLDSVNTDIVDIIGAPDSWCVPGIKESCLGIGLNDAVAEHLAALTNPFIAYNTYAHFLVRFGTIILGASRRHYRRVLSEHVERTGRAGMNLTEEDLKSIVQQFKEIAQVPTDPYEQLHVAIEEMYNCWYSPAAINYRTEALGASANMGTAVIIQTIVFGGTGVCFTRSPITGESGDNVYGTFWAKSGEKVPIQEYSKVDPNIYHTLCEVSRSLEEQFKDMAQYEFVVGEDRVLYILQAHGGKRTPKAAMKIAVDMVAEESITEREALLRVDPLKANYFLQRHLTQEQLDPSQTPAFGSGVGASRGVVTAPICFSAAACMEKALRGDVILCVRDCHAFDARALRTAAGVITMDGGLFSNAAILCRGMSKPCMTTAKDMMIVTEGAQIMLVNGNAQRLHEGDVVTLDGGNGRLLTGLHSTVSLALDPDFQQVLAWADKYRKLRIDASITSSESDPVSTLNRAWGNGADGIGCISTDGMFTNSQDRLNLINSVLIRREYADKPGHHIDRAAHLSTLCDLQKQDLKVLFRSILTASTPPHGPTRESITVNVKLLDKPLGSFLPTSQEDLVSMAGQMDLAIGEIKQAIHHMHDKNPDIGLRGCRVAAFAPEITEMQIRAIVSAALEVTTEAGPDNTTRVVPRILIPMICTSHELEKMRDLINKVAFQVYDEYKKENEKAGLVSDVYSVGAVFNSPRACLRAETMAPLISHVAFNTNDLTMQTFGCDKSDAEKFFPQYIFDQIYMADPFKSLDDMAVGALVTRAMEKCRAVNRRMEFSVVEGDHTSDARSIDFFADWGVHSICCPVERIPVARICAAQSQIKSENLLDNSDEPDWEDYMFAF